MMNDIADALKNLRQLTRHRDREFAALLKKKWRLSRLADHFGISRQRAQQIAKRLRKT